MKLYLVRHAKAGDRSQWTGDDRLRPLSRAGQRQAAALIDTLAGIAVQRIVSSPFVRCMETVVPLSGALGLPVEPSDALAEGASLEDATALVRKHVTHGAVLCSHGDVIPMLLEHFAAQGVDLGPAPSCAKGSTWVLRTDWSGRVVRARYLPPPAV